MLPKIASSATDLFAQISAPVLSMINKPKAATSLHEVMQSAGLSTGNSASKELASSSVSGELERSAGRVRGAESYAESAGKLLCEIERDMPRLKCKDDALELRNAIYKELMIGERPFALDERRSEWNRIKPSSTENSP